MIISTINRLVIWWRFRRVRFKSLGAKCEYAAINSYFRYPEHIVLGNFCSIGPGADFDGAGGIEIGDGVVFAPDVCIYSRSHNFDSEDLAALPFDNKVLCAKVSIRDYVWVGRRVIILPGVTIGKAAIIGAGAVVSKDVPDYAVLVGNPGRIVRYRDGDKVEKMIAEGDPFVYNKLGHGKVDIKYKKGE